MKFSLLTTVGALLLVGCEKQEPSYYPIDEETRTWLPEQDGQVLTFTAATGATQTVRVTRRQEMDEYQGKSFSVRSVMEVNFLVYKRALAPDSGFSLVVRYNKIAVLNTPAPSLYAISYGPLLGEINTKANPYQVDNNGQRFKLAFNQTLAGRTYPVLAAIDYVGVDSAATTGTNRLQRLYLAKDHGLVAFRTANGRLWLRQ